MYLFLTKKVTFSMVTKNTSKKNLQYIIRKTKVTISDEQRNVDKKKDELGNLHFDIFSVSNRSKPFEVNIFHILHEKKKERFICACKSRSCQNYVCLLFKTFGHKKLSSKKNGCLFHFFSQCQVPSQSTLNQKKRRFFNKR